MKVSTVSIDATILRNSLAAVLAIAALAAMNGRANAAELDPITVSTPTVQTVGRDPVTLAPIKDVTVKAKIAADEETLRNDSGVVLLKDRVFEAAYKVCEKADPFSFTESDCVHAAVKAAQPQVDAAIARARDYTAMQ